jgi:transposase-like protein
VVRGVSDEALAVRAAGGDGPAFEELARRYRSLLCAATWEARDDLEREEAHQAALIGLWDACRATDGVRRFAGIARRRVRWRVAAERRAKTRVKHRLLSDALQADDDLRPLAESVPAGESADPARVVELRETLRERLLERAERKRRKALAPGRDLRRRYTEQQRETALAVFGGGASIPAAAKAAGVPYSVAHGWITAAPADSAAGRELVARRGATGTLARSFSEQDKARAVALVEQGASIKSAARTVDASWPTVQRWLKQAA